jgi:phosphoribosylaminoimidazole (AIR) synthetase
MFRTFNMGVGMMVITDARSADAVISSAKAAGVEAWLAGRLARGSGSVILE